MSSPDASKQEPWLINYLEQTCAAAHPVSPRDKMDLPRVVVEGRRRPVDVTHHLPQPLLLREGIQDDHCSTGSQAGICLAKWPPTSRDLKEAAEVREENREETWPKRGSSREGAGERCWIWKSITLCWVESSGNRPNHPPLKVLSKKFLPLRVLFATSTLKLRLYCYLCLDRSSTSSSASQAWPCGLHVLRI